MHRRTLRQLRHLWSRRDALRGLGALGVVAPIACRSEDVSVGDTTSGDSTTGETTSTTEVDTGSSSGLADTSSDDSSSTGVDTPPQSDCESDETASFDELFAGIDHIVVLVMENRSFDHVLGSLALVEGRTLDGLSGRESNPDGDGNPVAVFPLGAANVEGDPSHSWNGSRVQWNEGANDGFVQSFETSGGPMPEQVMGYYERARLPITYALADNYAVCDRYFASVMGPTWPNRFHLNLGTSNGTMTNDAVSGLPSLFDRLDDAGISNVYYNAGIPFAFTFGKTEGFGTMSEFFDAAAAGTLPSFCMVDPIFTVGENLGNDDHPPVDPSFGQAFIASVYRALAASPSWNNTLLILTYDEHGGFFDHVPPPTTEDDLPEFRQLGFRVPTILIGPRVRRGCVTSTQLDHVSVVATVTRKWGLVPLSARAETTADLSSCMDPAFIDDPQPPAPIPELSVRRPPVVDPDVKRPGQTELLELAARHGWDRARRQKHEAEAFEAIMHWGQRLGVLRIVD